MIRLNDVTGNLKFDIDMDGGGNLYGSCTKRSRVTYNENRRTLTINLPEWIANVIDTVRSYRKKIKFNCDYEAEGRSWREGRKFRRNTEIKQ